MGAQVELLLPIWQVAGHWTGLRREEELYDASPPFRPQVCTRTVSHLWSNHGDLSC